MEKQGSDAAALAAGLALGTAGVLMLGLQPILLDQLVTAQRLRLEQAGPLAMTEIVAIGVGAALPNVLLPLHGLRRVALLATLLLAACNLATPLAPSLLPLLLLRAGAGVAGGVLVWLASLLIVRHRTPERLAAVFLLVQTLVQAGAAALLALVAIPAAGLAGGFAALALLCLLPLAGLGRLPARLPPLAGAASALPQFTAPVVRTLLVVVCGMAAISALWAFLDAIGRVSGLAAQQVQMLIAGTLVTQVAGAMAAGWLAPRLAAAAALVPGMLLLLGLAWAFGHAAPHSLAGFSALCAVFGFVWMFSMPFQVKLALRAEPGGRLAQLVPALQLLGSAVGPLVAGLLMTGDDDIAAISVTASAFACLAFLLLVTARRGTLAAPSFGGGERP